MASKVFLNRQVFFKFRSKVHDIVPIDVILIFIVISRHGTWLKESEAVAREVFYKKSVLKISQILQEKM